MAEPLADQIMRTVKQAAELHYQLMLVVAPAGAGNTIALHSVRDHTGAPLVNVNLLSRRMLEGHLNVDGRTVYRLVQRGEL